MAYFEKDFLDFFKELGRNNHKEWFDENRKRYESVVKDPFKAFVNDVILLMKSEDPLVDIEPKDAIFRINRDIRFSKDKTPYKTKVSAVVGRGGKKNKTSPGMYFELTPEHVRVYSGVFDLSKEQLYQIRTYIQDNLEEFNSIVNDPVFIKEFGELRGDKNKRLPKEFNETMEVQPLIANKMFYFFRQYEADLITKDELLEEMMATWQKAYPIRSFFMKALGEDE